MTVVESGEGPGLENVERKERVSTELKAIEIRPSVNKAVYEFRWKVPAQLNGHGYNYSHIWKPVEQKLHLNFLKEVSKKKN